MLIHLQMIFLSVPYAQMKVIKGVNVVCSILTIMKQIWTQIDGFIIWQGSLGVNPGVLIGSFLVGILPYGPFPWKWS